MCQLCHIYFVQDRLVNVSKFHEKSFLTHDPYHDSSSTGHDVQHNLIGTSVEGLKWGLTYSLKMRESKDPSYLITKCNQVIRLRELSMSRPSFCQWNSKVLIGVPHSKGAQVKSQLTEVGMNTKDIDVVVHVGLESTKHLLGSRSSAENGGSVCI